MGWPSQQLTALLAIDTPIVQAPMAGANGVDMAVAVSSAGGLGSLPAALLSPEQLQASVVEFRSHTSAALNINFFCHQPRQPNAEETASWHKLLAPYYEAIDSQPEASSGGGRRPFDAEMCALVEDLRPSVVSFHFGLPAADFVERVKAAGVRIFASATTVAEARWLAQRGCDVIIAQGCEAGGHRGLFLNDDINTQPGTLALVPQVVDAVDLPVIAAGGIADGRGIAAAFALGASGVQIGTAFLRCREALIGPLHRQRLASAAAEDTALTNLFSGRPARSLVNRLMRELGPLSDQVPPFPTAGLALAPLKRHAETEGRDDFSSLWSGQSAALATKYADELGADELLIMLREEALAAMQRLSG